MIFELHVVQDNLAYTRYWFNVYAKQEFVV